MVLPVLLDKVVEPLGIARTFQILSIFMLVQALLALTFKPLMPAGGGMGPPSMGPRPDNPQNQTGTTGPTASKWSRFLMGVRKFFNLRVFYIVTYRVWACGVATAVFGYFVPYIHLVRWSMMHIWFFNFPIFAFKYSVLPSPYPTLSVMVMKKISTA